MTLGQNGIKLPDIPVNAPTIPIGLNKYGAEALRILPISALDRSPKFLPKSIELMLPIFVGNFSILLQRKDDVSIRGKDVRPEPVCINTSRYRGFAGTGWRRGHWRAR